MYSISRMFYRWGSVLVCSLAVFGCETKTPRTNSLVPNPHSRANLSASPRCALAKRWLDDARHSAQSGNLLAAKHRRDRAKKLCPEVPADSALPGQPANTEALPKDWLAAANAERDRGNMSKYNALVVNGLQKDTPPGQVPLSVLVAEAYFAYPLESSLTGGVTTHDSYFERRVKRSEQPFSLLGIDGRRFLYNESKKRYESTFPVSSDCSLNRSTLDRKYLLVGCFRRPSTLILTTDGRTLRTIDYEQKFVTFSPDQKRVFFQEHGRETSGKQAVFSYPTDPKRLPWSIEFSKLFPNEKAGEETHVSFVEELQAVAIDWENNHQSLHSLADGSMIERIDIPNEFKQAKWQTHKQWLTTYVNAKGKVFVRNLKQKKSFRIDVTSLVDRLRADEPPESLKDGSWSPEILFHPRKPWMMLASGYSQKVAGWIDLETGKLYSSKKHKNSRELAPYPHSWLSGSDFYLYGPIVSHQGSEEELLSQDIGLSDGNGTSIVLFAKEKQNPPFLLALDDHRPQATFLDPTSWEVKTVKEKDGSWQIDSKKLGPFTNKAKIKFAHGKLVVVAENGHLVVVDWESGKESFRIKDGSPQDTELFSAITFGARLETGAKIPSVIQDDPSADVMEKFATLVPKSIQIEKDQVRYRINEDQFQRIWNLKDGKLETSSFKQNQKALPSPWRNANQKVMCGRSVITKIHQASSLRFWIGMEKGEKGRKDFVCVWDTKKHEIIGKGSNIDMAVSLSPDQQLIGFYTARQPLFPEQNVYQIWGKDGKLVLELKGLDNIQLFNNYVLFLTAHDIRKKNERTYFSFVKISDSSHEKNIVLSGKYAVGKELQSYTDASGRFLASVDLSVVKKGKGSVHFMDMEHGELMLSVPIAEMVDPSKQTFDYFTNWKNPNYRRPHNLDFAVDLERKKLVVAFSKTVKVYSLESKKALVSLNVFPNQAQGLATYPDGYFELFGKRDLSKTAHHLHCLYGSRILPLDICQPWLEDAGRMALTFQLNHTILLGYCSRQNFSVRMVAVRLGLVSHWIGGENTAPTPSWNLFSRLLLLR
jgi:hypothetical protein